MKEKSGKIRIWLTGALIILTACNLRAPITGVGALVDTISGDLGLSPSAAGFLTTIPLLAFAGISLLVSPLSRRLGAGNLLLAGLGLLTAGILLRSLAGNAGVFLGTAAAGAGIAVGNVLLPALVKSFFPDRIEQMTSAYTAVMQVTSAISTGISVPLAAAAGWKAALLVWALPAMGALALCITRRKTTVSEGSDKPEKGKKSMYRHPMTWWVTAYMGVQSFIFYSCIGWLSSIMQDKGMTQTEGGYMLSLYVVMGIAGSCALPFIMRKNKTQSVTGMQMGITYTAGLLMLLCDSYVLTAAGIILCGICSGTCISFSMALFGLHTSKGREASRLSGTAQAAGYFIAAAGPVLLGRVFEAAGGWTAPLLILVGAALFLVLAGYVAGKDEIIC
ncbi:MAG TPA: MFS transporter [Candidatus Copromorpha excrementigallinarum]|uniref:MFS transporter n=1 Tax=Candidatus Allocopromorpha excrementigallinarum TaxID=2840742 RepID=A0A9D1HZ59_9FIRM|nr:MFS transporter [Candidatus Copromorpha excrementigallinarum]